MTDTYIPTKLAHKRLLEVVDYNPDSGVFTNLLAGKGRPPVGKKLGGTNKVLGYFEISVDYKKYYGHRLAWFYMTGRWPKQEVDHINGIRNDNRWHNLREASSGINSHNIGGAFCNNKLGILGVSHHKASGLYRASIVSEGVAHVTWHKTPEAAGASYLRLKHELHPTHKRLKGRQ